MVLCVVVCKLSPMLSVGARCDHNWKDHSERTKENHQIITLHFIQEKWRFDLGVDLYNVGQQGCVGWKDLLRFNLLRRRNIVNMVAQCHKKIKEERCSTIEHLKLHGAAALESATRANDQGKIVCTQLGVSVWSVGIGIPSRSQDSAALDTGFWAC